ncbi:thioesterase II family protein [Streptomyces litchfieldiae]|uniref:Alpha/beta fold hydrolase n=1 Tax=Streptomyces litchfieldiae TaxID=3075543 RepID=A0ABU2MS74_9ACTN|nr:alpha/beta fold hydrolase [Streptomyces sp. DSM 44938]MDT0344370.1 alpha/beta fold hydrolase [Streptomyces sp. DSM 44938]
MADSDTWIRRFHPAPRGRLRLVCFPHAGGAASFYYPVSQALHPDIEVLSLQYPGRQDRRTEPPVPDIMPLAEQVAEALLPWKEGPWAFFGHSMGAVVAFEAARILEGTPGAAPLTQLIVSGRRAPGTRRDEAVHERDDDGLIAEMRRLNGTESGVLDNEELLRMVLPALRNDYRAIETYRGDPGARVSCPITALIGDDDPKATVEETRAWAEHTTGGFDMHVFRGGHFFLVDRQLEVLELITSSLKGTDDE